MKRLNWGILIVTLLISVLAVTSAFGAHDKVNEVKVNLGDLVDKHRSIEAEVASVGRDVAFMEQQVEALREVVQQRVEPVVEVSPASAMPVVLVFTQGDFIASGSSINEAPKAMLGETIVVTGVGFQGRSVTVSVGGVEVGKFELYAGGMFKERVEVPIDIYVREVTGLYELKVVKAENENSAAVYPIWIGERD